MAKTAEEQISALRVGADKEAFYAMKVPGRKRIALVHQVGRSVMRAGWFESEEVADAFMDWQDAIQAAIDGEAGR